MGKWLPVPLPPPQHTRTPIGKKLPVCLYDNDRKNDSDNNNDDENRNDNDNDNNRIHNNILDLVIGTGSRRYVIPLIPKRKFVTS